MVFSPQHLAERLTPYPLPTKDGGVLRTIGDARAYMLALSKEREWLDHWKPAYRLLVVGAGAAELTQQVQLALSRVHAVQAAAAAVWFACARRRVLSSFSLPQ